MLKSSQFVVLSAVFAGTTAFAQLGDTITWKSTTPKSEGAWPDPTQWDLGRVPEDGDIIVLPSPTGGTASYNFMTTTASGRLPATGRFKRLEISAAHRLRMAGKGMLLIFC